jgi:hypothetical protein
MHAARGAALIPRSALAIAVLLVVGSTAPAQADHGRHGFRHPFFFGFNGVGFPPAYPGPVVAYPAAPYPPPQYYYYPPPAAYYAPPAAYYAPQGGYYVPTAAYYSAPPAAYNPPPAAYNPPPAAEHPPPAASDVRPPAGRATQVASGKDCYEAQHMINIDGRSVSAHGTLCQQPDGSYALSDPYRGSVASSR